MNSVFDDLRGRGFPFAISLSAGPVTYVSSLAHGWRSAGSFEPVRLGQSAAPRPRSPLRALAARVAPLRRVFRVVRLRRAGGIFAGLDRWGSGDLGKISVSPSPRIEAMADLIARLPWDGRIRHVRDARYLGWRFRNPSREYRFLFAEGDRLQGYLVLQRVRSDLDDLERVSIVDWEATSDQVRADLLAAALNLGRFGHVYAWMAGAGDSTRALLHEHGFASDSNRITARHQGLLVRRLGEDPDPAHWRLGSRSLLSIDDWDMRMLYSMSG
jgi:hypothetical protein